MIYINLWGQIDQTEIVFDDTNDCHLFKVHFQNKIKLLTNAISDDVATVSKIYN